MPYSIYRGDPNWVAPILSDLRKVFLDSNPLFSHAQMRIWIATQGGRDVGRIAGIIDRNHIGKHHDATAFWGFFESVNDPAVAESLFKAVAEWARQNSARRLLGPMNPTTNDECGLLIDAFDKPPVIMMTYNPSYYPALVEAAGFKKAKDLLAYHFTLSTEPLERLQKIARGVARRNPDIKIVHIRKRHLADDLSKVKTVYNAAWEDNWGFIPMTDSELEFMAARLKPLLVEDYALLAEDKGKPIAFMLTLPDYNEAIRPLRGKLMTPRLIGFLKYLMGWRVPKIARAITMGIVKEYRQRGIDAMLLAHTLENALKRGVKEGELSWMLEDNQMILRPMTAFNAVRYKTYRLYDRVLP